MKNLAQTLGLAVALLGAPLWAGQAPSPGSADRDIQLHSPTQAPPRDDPDSVDGEDPPESATDPDDPGVPPETSDG